MASLRNHLAALFGLFAIASGCAPPPSPPPPSPSLGPKLVYSQARPPPAPTVEPAHAAPPLPPEPPSAPLTVAQRLDKRAVTDESYARRELYSWTTPEQIDELRKSRLLLVATAKTHGAPSPYSRLLSRLLKGTGNTAAMAKLFAEHPGLTKRRYAWPSPFATAVPLGERSYGHALIRIVLKEEALTMKLDPLEKEPFSLMRLNGQAAPLAEALEHPEHIGAVFHVRRKPDGGPRFREYIVCNEAMIARWSVATAQERAIVAEEAALIAELLQSPLVSALGKKDLLDANAAWSRRTEGPSLLDAWRAALAFDSPKYKPTEATLSAIAASLAAYDTTEEPLEHVPNAVFPKSP